MDGWMKEREKKKKKKKRRIEVNNYDLWLKIRKRKRDQNRHGWSSIETTCFTKRKRMAECYARTVADRVVFWKEKTINWNI